MNAPLPSEELLKREAWRPANPQLLPREGVFRYVWHGRFGPMLIEVSEGRSYVNGQLVEPAAAVANGGVRG